jgi:hypothetical protein
MDPGHHGLWVQVGARPCLELGIVWIAGTKSQAPQLDEALVRVVGNEQDVMPRLLEARSNPEDAAGRGEVRRQLAC